MTTQGQSLRFRMSEDRDVAMVRRLFRHSFQAQCGPYHLDQVRIALASGLGAADRLFAQGKGLVAEIDATAVGAGAWQDGVHSLPGQPPLRGLNDQLVASLRGICIAPAMAGHGVGRRLVHALIAEVARRNFTHVMLNATLGAAPLYERCGFTARAHFDVPCGEGLAVPCVLMDRPIARGSAALSIATTARQIGGSAGVGSP